MTLVDRMLVENLSARFTQAMTEPKLDLLESMITDDFVIWYNFSNTQRTREEVLPFFHAYFPTVNVRFDAIRLTATETGWVQQHVVNADGPDGFTIRNMHACLVFTLAGEKIARLDEYIDSAQSGGFDTSRIERGE
jgi:ketosteroid isomerase-like protein